MKLKNSKNPRSLFVGTNRGSRTGRKESHLDIRRGAVEVMNYRLVKRVIILSIIIIACVLLIGYAFVLIYNRTGRFTVTIENTNTTFALTLCEHEDFELRSAVLTNDQQVRMTNISGNTIPQNVDHEDGEHNGKNYLAYTFYCKNVGSTEASLNYEMTFNNVTNHIDECVRVRIYVTSLNGQNEVHNKNVDGYTDYAKTRSDGKGDEENFCDKSFSGSSVVCDDYVNNVKVGDIVRFTIVIWVEGDDMDCNDSVINGMVKFDMTISAKTVVKSE